MASEPWTCPLCGEGYPAGYPTETYETAWKIRHENGYREGFIDGVNAAAGDHADDGGTALAGLAVVAFLSAVILSVAIIVAAIILA